MQNFNLKKWCVSCGPGKFCSLHPQLEIQGCERWGLPVRTEAEIVEFITGSTVRSLCFVSAAQCTCRYQCTFLFFTSLTNFSSSCTLAFPIPSLHVHVTFLHLCLHCLYFSFFSLRLNSRSSFSHAGFLPYHRKSESVYETK